MEAVGVSHWRAAATSRSRSPSLVASQSSSDGPCALRCGPPWRRACPARGPIGCRAAGRCAAAARQCCRRTSATRLVATGLSGSRPTSVSASGTPCTDRRPSSTVRPVAGNAGVTTTSRAPDASAAAPISDPRVAAQRRVDLDVAGPSGRRRARRRRLSATTSAASRAGIRRVSMFTDTRSACGAPVMSRPADTNDETPRPANAAAQSSAPVRSSASSTMRARWSGPCCLRWLLVQTTSPSVGPCRIISRPGSNDPGRVDSRRRSTARDW